MDAVALRAPRVRRGGSRRPGLPAPAGFGLLEALIACGLIVVLAAGVAQLTLASVAAVRASGDETLALLLAVQKIEQLRSPAWDRGGPRATVSPAGSLDASVPGYVDYRSRRGTRVGGGARPPSGTAFVRRWSVQPHPRLPDDLLVLDVVVLPLRVAERAAAAALSPNVPGVVRLSALKGRR